MLIRLIPKTTHAQDIVEKHGEVFEVKDLSVYLIAPSGKELAPKFRVHSLKKTNNVPFIGPRTYWFWLSCRGSKDYDFQILVD